MKRKILALLLVVVLSIAVLSSCAELKDALAGTPLEGLLPHEHTFSEEWSKDATNHWHEATCEHTDEVSDKAAHSYVDGVCVCGAEAPKPHEHAFSDEWSKNKTHHWHAAICGHDSYKKDQAEHVYVDGVCVCGAEEPVAPHEHSYTASVTAPTCTEAGFTTYTCTCGDSYVADEVAALGHTEETIPGKAATCTETGLTDGKKCSVCGEILTAQTEIPAIPHTEEIIPGKAATCTEAGLTDGKKCSVCGETITAQTEIPALGHSYGDDNTCDVCGNVATPDGTATNPFVATLPGTISVSYDGGDDVWYVFTAPSTGKLIFAIGNNVTMGYYVEGSLVYSAENDTKVTLEVTEGENYKICFSTTDFSVADFTVSADYQNNSEYYNAAMYAGENNVMFSEAEMAANTAVRTLVITKASKYAFKCDFLVSSIVDAEGNVIARGDDYSYELAEGEYTVTFGMLTISSSTVADAFVSVTVTDKNATEPEEPDDPIVGESDLVIGENTVVIEESEATAGKQLTFIATAAGTYTFASNDLSVQICDEDGMPISFGQAYLEAGKYIIGVRNTAEAAGTFTLTITYEAPAAEEGSQDNPYEITLPAADLQVNCDSLNMIYYTFSTTEEGIITITYSNANSWVVIANADDHSDSDGDSSKQVITFEVQANSTYIVGLGTWDPDDGVTASIDFTAQKLASEGDFTKPIYLWAGDSYTFNYTEGAEDKFVWYTFNPWVSGPATITLSEGTTVMYGQDPENLTTVVDQTSVVFDVVAYENYYIAIQPTNLQDATLSILVEVGESTGTVAGSTWADAYDAWPGENVGTAIAAWENVYFRYEAFVNGTLTISDIPEGLYMEFGTVIDGTDIVENGSVVNIVAGTVYKIVVYGATTDIYFNLTFEASEGGEDGPVVPEGDYIEVETTDTYVWDDYYSFTAPAAGKYTFAIPAGLGFFNKVTKDSSMYANPEIHYYDNENGMTIAYDLAAGETLEFYVGATNKATWYITYTFEAAEAPSENVINVTTTDTYGFFDEYTFVANGEGKYTFVIPAGLSFWSAASRNPEIDFQMQPDGGVLEFMLAEGEALVFQVGAGTKSDWTITYTFEACEVGGGDDPVDPPVEYFKDANGLGGEYSFFFVVGNFELTFAPAFEGADYGYLTVVDPATYSNSGTFAYTIVDGQYVFEGEVPSVIVTHDNVNWLFQNSTLRQPQAFAEYGSQGEEPSDDISGTYTGTDLWGNSPLTVAIDSANGTVVFTYTHPMLGTSTVSATYAIVDGAMVLYGEDGEVLNPLAGSVTLENGVPVAASYNGNNYTLAIGGSTDPEEPAEGIEGTYTVTDSWGNEMTVIIDATTISFTPPMNNTIVYEYVCENGIYSFFKNGVQVTSPAEFYLEVVDGVPTAMMYNGTSYSFATGSTEEPEEPKPEDALIGYYNNFGTFSMMISEENLNVWGDGFDVYFDYVVVVNDDGSMTLVLTLQADQVDPYGFADAIVTATVVDGVAEVTVSNFEISFESLVLGDNVINVTEEMIGQGSVKYAFTAPESGFYKFSTGVAIYTENGDYVASGNTFLSAGNYFITFYTYEMVPGEFTLTAEKTTILALDEAELKAAIQGEYKIDDLTYYLYNDQWDSGDFIFNVYNTTWTVDVYFTFTVEAVSETEVLVTVGALANKTQTGELALEGATFKATYADGAWTLAKVEGEAPHEHTYTPVVTAPTCVTAGFITYTCECGDSYTEAGEPATGIHTWVEDTNADDTITKYCSYCTYVVEEIEGVRVNTHGSKNGSLNTTTDEEGNELWVSADYDGGNGLKVNVAWPSPIVANSANNNYVTSYSRIRFGNGVTVTITYEGGTFDTLYWYFDQNYNATSSTAGARSGRKLYNEVCEGTFASKLGINATSVSFVNGDHNVLAPEELLPGYVKIELAEPVSELVFTTASGDYYVGHFKVDAEKTYDAGVNHPHTFGEGVVTDPTCTDKGYTTYTCTVCGESCIKDEVAALNHDYKAVVTEPTCSAAGYTTYTCTVCGDSYTADEVEALPHTYDEVVTPPTATENGYTTFTCSVCGYSYVGDEVPAIGHSYVPVVTDPTCTEKGYTTYTCSECGDSYVGDEVPALGHKYDKVVTDPTCVTAGIITYTCSVCGDSYTEAGEPATGIHTWVEDTNADDKVSQFCSVCGYCEIVETLSFDLTDYQTTETDADGVINKITWNNPGVDSYVVFENSALTQVKPARLNNGGSATFYGNGISKIVWTMNGTLKETWKDCGSNNYLKGVFRLNEQIIAGTLCDTNGVNIIFDSSDERNNTQVTFEFETPVDSFTINNISDNRFYSFARVEFHSFEQGEVPHVHSYEANVTPATCTAGGYTTYTCECGDSYKADETEALGHKWVDATYDAPKTCSVCGATEGEALPAAASVDGKKYGTFAEAFAQAHDGSIVTLLADLELSEILVIDKSMTLDGNGFKLTSSAARAINVSGADGVEIKGLTIVASGERAINVIQGATNVTITNVIATANNYTVNVAGSAANAVITINNSTLTGLNVVNVGAAGVQVSICDTTLVCNDMNDAEHYAAIALNAEAKDSKVTAEGVTFQIEGDSLKASSAAINGVITIDGSEAEVKKAVAVIGDLNDDYYYVAYSLADAIAAAANGQTITLIADSAETKCIVIEADKVVTIDLNGFTVSYTSDVMGEAMITNRGQLTINDSGENGEIFYNYIGAADSNYGKGNYTISNSGNLVINGGKLHIANLSSHAKYVVDNNSGSADAILTVNGGHLYNYNTSAIRMFCNSTTNMNVVTINGGLIEGYCAIWMQNPGKNTVNCQLAITGGEIRSTAAAYVNGSKPLAEVSSAIYATISGEGGAWSTISCVKINGGIFNENVYLLDKAPNAYIAEGATFNGYVEHDHAYVGLNCENAGTCACGAVAEALGHKYISDVIDPTCDKEGYTENVCERCGNVNNTDTVPALGHNYISEVVAPTCTAEGFTSYECDRCFDAYDDTYVPALGHADENADYKCDRCSTKMLPAADEFLTIPQALAVAKAAGTTYTTEKYFITGIVTNVYNTTYGNLYLKDADGNQICIYGLYTWDKAVRYDKMEYKPVEGDELTVYTVLGMYNTTAQGKDAWIDDVVAHEHDYKDVVTEATCTNEGYTTHTCTICNLSTKDTEVPALGHTTEAGTCERCGKEIGGDAPVVKDPVVFEFGANGSAAHVDGNSIGASKTYTEGSATLKLTGMANVYGPAYDAKGNSCIKLGASSKAGSGTITVDDDVTSVVIKVAKYKANTSKITINGTTYTLTNNSNDGAYDEIVIDTTTTKTITFTTVSGGWRCMINSITYNYD